MACRIYWNSEDYAPQLSDEGFYYRSLASNEDGNLDPFYIYLSFKTDLTVDDVKQSIVDEEDDEARIDLAGSGYVDDATRIIFKIEKDEDGDFDLTCVSLNGESVNISVAGDFRKFSEGIAPALEISPTVLRNVFALAGLHNGDSDWVEDMPVWFSYDTAGEVVIEPISDLEEETGPYTYVYLNRVAVDEDGVMDPDEFYDGKYEWGILRMHDGGDDWHDPWYDEEVLREDFNLGDSDLEAVRKDTEDAKTKGYSVPDDDDC